ncbi:MAG TPA: DUF2683 family protein [Flavobacteriaceae bacterium]|nr:DUF2683 family protein [Flavobacteriaceae bacterium]
MKKQDIFIAHPETAEEVAALKAFMEALKIKFEVSKPKQYNPEFISKIEESKTQYENEDYISIEHKDIKKFLDLE